MKNNKMFYTLEEATNQLEKFEQLLKKHHIIIPFESELERLCLNVYQTGYKHVDPNLRNPNADIRQDYRDFIGLQDLITKILKAEHHPDFKKLLPHLQKIAESNPIQNSTTSVLDQDNNKLFELYIATLCMALNPTFISLDDPDNSSGDNPDIIVNLMHEVWGIACKAPHSPNPQSIFDNIEKAVKQIQNSTATIGIPTLTFKNILKHDELWPILNEKEVKIGKEPLFAAYMNKSHVLGKIQEYIKETRDNIAIHIGIDEIKKLFHGTKSEPACLIYCPTVIFKEKNGKPIPLRINTFSIMQFHKEPSEKCKMFLNDLNHQLQLV